MYKKYKVLKNKKYIHNKVFIQAVELHHLEKIRKWRNNQINILRQSKKITKTEQFKYYNKNIIKNKKSINPDNIIFTIYYDNKFIGYGGLVHISWMNKRAELSFLLNEKIKVHSKNFKIIFSDFFTLVKTISTLELNLTKITTETFSHRKKMLNYLEQNGFIKEGLLKKHYKKLNYVDSILHSFYLR